MTFPPITLLLALLIEASDGISYPGTTQELGHISGSTGFKNQTFGLLNSPEISIGFDILA